MILATDIKMKTHHLESSWKHYGRKINCHNYSILTQYFDSMHHALLFSKKSECHGLCTLLNFKTAASFLNRGYIRTKTVVGGLKRWWSFVHLLARKNWNKSPHFEISEKLTFSPEHLLFYPKAILFDYLYIIVTKYTTIYDIWSEMSVLIYC